MLSEKTLRIQELFSAGKTSREICEMLHLPYASVIYAKNAVSFSCPKEFSKKQKISDEDLDKIKELRSQGLSQKKIAEIMNVSVGCIRYHLLSKEAFENYRESRKKYVRKYRTKNKESLERHNELLRNYNKIKASILKKPKAKRYSEEDVEKVRNLRKPGYSLNKIAAMTGINYTTVFVYNLSEEDRKKFYEKRKARYNKFCQNKND